jgi:hypothetical protein
MSALRPYDPVRRVEILGDLWTATKADHTLRVELRTHTLGWELRALVASQMHRTQVCKTEAEVHSTSETWATEATAKGWVVTAGTLR